MCCREYKEPDADLDTYFHIFIRKVGHCLDIDMYLPPTIEELMPFKFEIPEPKEIGPQPTFVRKMAKPASVIKIEEDLKEY